MGNETALLGFWELQTAVVRCPLTAEVSYREVRRRLEGSAIYGHQRGDKAQVMWHVAQRPHRKEKPHSQLVLLSELKCALKTCGAGARPNGRNGLPAWKSLPAAPMGRHPARGVMERFAMAEGD